MRPQLRNRAIVRAAVHAVVFAAMLVATSAHQSQGTRVTPAEPPTILFMCPHGAAKSVLASAYFQRLAKERGLNVQVISAGTQPDPQVAPAVANHLTKNGYAVPVSKPRRVTDAELSSADVVISMGCDLKGLPTPRGTLMNWDDVPALMATLTTDAVLYPSTLPRSSAATPSRSSGSLPRRPRASSPWTGALTACMSTEIPS